MESDFIYFRPSVAINSLASPPIFPLHFPSSTLVIPLSLSLSLSLSLETLCSLAYPGSPLPYRAALCHATACVPHLSRFSLFPPTVTQFAAGIVSSAHASGSRLHRGASAPGFHTLLLLLFATQHLGYQHRCPSLSFSFSLHILTDHLSFIRYDVSLFFSLSLSLSWLSRMRQKR